MKKILVVIIIATFALKNFAAPAESGRVTENFDAGWRFLKADASGAEQNQFDDSAWRQLDVPHDWSIEGPFEETNKSGTAGAFLPNGVGWYRKHFTLPENDSARRVSIEFDGVMANSDVWINGFHLGKRPFGYASFGYDLTGHLNFGGKENVLSVRVDNSVQPASRWYEGAGIYRHVRLVATDPVHIVENGVFISTPGIGSNQATVHVQTTVTNESNSSREIFLGFSLLDPDGKEVNFATMGLVATLSQTLAAGKSAQIDQDIVVANPQLWNLDKPVLYRARVTLYNGVNRALNLEDSSAVRSLDNETNTFGIRDAKFIADTGFWLNGKNFKVKGVAVHCDGGAFGDAVPLGVWEQRLTELKKLGVNAIRTAHNPPSPEFLDLCDRLGLLVMDELFDVWTVGKSSLDGQKLADYHLYFNDWSSIDAAATVQRDRNHPSVILYSSGNEIHDTPNAALANRILTRLISVFHTNDPTRPVTQALFRPNVSHDYDNGLADLLDVVGQNYRVDEILAAHTQNPARKIIGTENIHDRQSWVALRDHPAYAGQFLWTGIDYLGESRAWPVVVSGSGLLNRTGAPRPLAFERQSWWSDVPMVSIARRTAPATAGANPAGGNAPDRRPQTTFADWTPRNSAPHDENVEVYSNCKEVELFLNGESLGVKPLNNDASPRVWRVAYAPGTLKAVAKNGGAIVATDELRTAGEPAKIVLTPDASTVADNWDGIVRVTAAVVDKDGAVVPGADALVSFKISGPGVIAAVDNANNASHESFQASERHAFQGRCVAFVKASAPSGKIILTASAPGLTGDLATIRISESR
jgi:beta-galactosidase